MKKQTAILLTAACILLTGSYAQAGTAINGAGASFPFPIYSQWAFEYEKIAGVKLNYQPIGSGGGIAQIKAKTVDFGASDAPLELKELNEAGLTQFPMVVGGVVAVVNIKGVKAGELKLSRQVLADIFLGNITSWDDPKISALNPNLTLPKKGITVVRRSDGSGTTWIFTNYLSKISPEWKSKVGADKAVNWPVGMGAKGNEGVAANVQRIGGSIGYVEYAFAKKNKMAFTQLENGEGAYLTPSIETFQAAAANGDWKAAPGYFMVLVDQPGKDSWPITGASFILIYKDSPSSAQAEAMLKFFDWCFKNGAEGAKKLDYVPLPQNVYELVENTWKEQVKSAGSPVWK